MAGYPRDGAELQLALQHALTAENAPLFARDILDQVSAQGIPLGFTATTLEYLDSVMESLRANSVALEQVPEVLFGFGCVLGEVIAQTTGGTWVATTFAIPIGLQVDDATLDPVGFAFASLSSGISFVEYFARRS